jgi:predicted component of type VI protein secretion system
MEPSFPSAVDYSLVRNRLDVYGFCAPAEAEIQAEVVLDHFPYVLGRHPECDLSLFSRQVSRRHCQFFRRGEEIWIEDLNSHNGTFLNDQEIRKAVLVRDGDVLVIHPYRYQLHLDTGSPEGLRLHLVPDGMGSPR